MRYAIFSDIHGNFQAIDSVLKALKTQAIDSYICLGDIVGYGGNPHECTLAVKNLKAVSVAGNHDWAVLGRIGTQYFNPLAREAVFWTKNNSFAEDLGYLEKMPLVYRNDIFVAVHGTLPKPEYFEYLIDPWQAKQVFKSTEAKLCFVGHSHIAGFFREKGNEINYSPSVDMALEDSCRYVINVGSVGQPRDGNPMAAFCIFDTQKKTVAVKRINYDIEEAQKQILRAGLSPYLANRLSLGR